MALYLYSSQHHEGTLSTNTEVWIQFVCSGKLIGFSSHMFLCSNSLKPRHLNGNYP